MKTPNNKYVSMRGVEVDMQKLAMDNADTIAVTGWTSKVRMNARGDILERNGKVRQTREEIVENYHKEIEGNVHVPEKLVPDTFVSPAEAIKIAQEQALKAKEAEAKVAPVRQQRPAPVRSQPPKQRTLIEDDNEE